MTQISHLKHIAQISYDKVHKTYQMTVQEEQRLRQELERLSELAQTSATRVDDRVAMQLLGADVQWQAWIGRAKTATNLQLARVLAKKATQQEILRVSFGKKSALQEIDKEFRKTRDQKKARDGLEESIQIGLCQSFAIRNFSDDRS